MPPEISIIFFSSFKSNLLMLYPRDLSPHDTSLKFQLFFSLILQTFSPHYVFQDFQLSL